MKAITFLGAATAYETTYVMPDQREYTAPFCGVALAHFYPDLQMRVFVTEEAKRKHFSRFASMVEGHVADVVEVPIPDGKDDAELWRIFECVVDAVGPDEQVLFDITHGFRSLPFLSFIAAAYLRIVKRINLSGVLYGNFEARDQSVTPNRAPILEMTAFVGLFDWMIAADRFIRFGDAEDLAEQLRKSRPAWQDQQKDKKLADQARMIAGVTNSLNDVSRALRLLRPMDAMHASQVIQTRFGGAIQQAGVHAHPFRSIAQQVLSCYAPIALGKEQRDADVVTILTTERTLVQWYLDRKQYVPAVAIAREWLVSWLMAHLSCGDLLDRDQRKAAEDLLGNAIHEQRKSQDAKISGQLIGLLDSHVQPDLEKAIALFDQLGNVRNDLLHAGKRKGALSAEVLEKQIVQYCTALFELKLPAETEIKS